MLKRRSCFSIRSSTNVFYRSLNVIHNPNQTFRMRLKQWWLEESQQFSSCIQFMKYFFNTNEHSVPTLWRENICKISCIHLWINLKCDVCGLLVAKIQGQFIQLFTIFRLFTVYWQERFAWIFTIFGKWMIPHAKIARTFHNKGCPIRLNLYWKHSQLCYLDRCIETTPIFYSVDSKEI